MVAIVPRKDSKCLSKFTNRIILARRAGLDTGGKRLLLPLAGIYEEPRGVGFLVHREANEFRTEVSKSR